MNKQLGALAVVLGLGGFGAANANVAVAEVPQFHVMHWATAVLCDSDGDRVAEVCADGHTGYVVNELVDVTLSAFPHNPGVVFLAR